MSTESKELVLQLTYKDWVKRPKRWRAAFGLLYANRMTQGWSFLGTSREQHEQDVKNLVQKANDWAKAKNLETI